MAKLVGVSSLYHPTKLVTSRQDLDLPDLTLNLVFDHTPSDRELHLFSKDFKQIQFFVEQSVFSTGEFPELDFGVAAHVMAIVGDQLLPTREIKDQVRNRSWAIDYGQGFFAQAGLVSAVNLKERLEELQVAANQIGLLNVTQRPEVDNSVRQLIPASNLITLDHSRPETFWSALRHQKKEIVLLLIDGDEDKVEAHRDSAEAISLQLSDFERELASRSVAVIRLACPMSEANDLVSRLGDALHAQTSTTAMALLQRITASRSGGPQDIFVKQLEVTSDTYRFEFAFLDDTTAVVSGERFSSGILPAMSVAVREQSNHSHLVSVIIFIIVFFGAVLFGAGYLIRKDRRGPLQS